MGKGNYGADDLRALRGNPKAAGQVSDAIRKGIEQAKAEKPKAKPALAQPADGPFAALRAKLKAAKR